MADFTGVTACNGIKLKPGVEDYLKDFQIIGEDITCAVDKSDGAFMFHGYCWPSIYREGDDDFDEDIGDEFYSGLRKFVPKGKKLEIQMIGNTKCRWPLAALHIVITPRRVSYKPLN